MKKLAIVLFFIIIQSVLIAQVIKFEEVFLNDSTTPTNLDFEGVMYSSIAYGDIDGDNDFDVVISGSNTSRVTYLYENDGFGNFSLVDEAMFENLNNSSVAFSDIDGDNDQDLIITGENNLGNSVSKLYLNDGIGNFAESEEVQFADVKCGSVAFCDVDNDDDQDLLLSGLSNEGNVTILYMNDGSGNFSENTEQSFDGLINSSIAFTDIDNDNDEDLIIIGTMNLDQRVAKLYRNDPTGNFTEIADAPFVGVDRGSIGVIDIEGDSDKDLLITGRNSNGIGTAKLYINDGSGIFTEQTDTIFERVDNSSIVVCDINNDNAPDIIISGENNVYNDRVTKLYYNNSDGSFTEHPTIFEGVEFGHIVAFDVNSDTYKDVILSGLNQIHQKVARLYINRGDSVFIDVPQTMFDRVWLSSAAFLDVDNDWDQDVIITGKNQTGATATLYQNDGLGNYTIMNDTTFTGVQNSMLAVSDIESDGDFDILICGLDNSENKIAELFINDGNGNLIKDTNTLFTGVSDGSIDFCDIDGDNDEDVLITGRNDQGQALTSLYRNNGGVSFEIIDEIPLVNIYQGDAAFADIDNDNDMDLLIAGRTNTSYGYGTTKLYINDGSGNFSMSSSNIFPEFRNCSINFGDIDNDNDQDLLISGSDDNYQRHTSLYTNNNGVFTLVSQSQTPFEKVTLCHNGFCDVDEDNDLDILITGYNNSNETITKLYSNDGSGNFTEVENMPFKGIDTGFIAFSDIDNDNDQDLLLTGWGVNRLITNLYRNITCNNTYATDQIVACNSYTWLNGVTYHDNNNTDVIILPNADGCDSIITLDLTITTVDVTVSMIEHTATVSEPDAIYQWLDCSDNFSIINGATNQSFTPVDNGNYAVEVISNNCADTSSCIEIIILENLEIIIDKSISIYPKPSNGQLIIEGNNIKSVSIYSLEGKLIFFEQTNEKEHILDLSDIISGVYLIKIETNKGFHTEKVMFN